MLFDLDGTLVDSTAAVVRSWVTWALEHGVDPVRLQGYHGVPARQIVAELVRPDRVGRRPRRIDELELLDAAGVVALPGALHGAGRAARRSGRGGDVVHPSAGAGQDQAAGLSVPETVVTADDVHARKARP